jgi:DNA polymerase
MYHPAAALHQGNLRKIIEEDMLKIPDILNNIQPNLQVKEEERQLNLF